MDYDRFLAVLQPVLPWAEAARDRLLAIPGPYWAAGALLALVLWLRAAARNRSLGRQLLALETEHAGLKDLHEKEKMWRLAADRVEARIPAAAKPAVKVPAPTGT